MDFYDRLLGRFGNLTVEQERDMARYYKRIRSTTMAVLADPATAFNLMQAVAALDAAADGHESGSLAWLLIKVVQASATDLVEHEVNNTWPTGDGARSIPD